MKIYLMIFSSTKTKYHAMVRFVSVYHLFYPSQLDVNLCSTWLLHFEYFGKTALWVQTDCRLCLEMTPCSTSPVISPDPNVRTYCIYLSYAHVLLLEISETIVSEN